MSRRTKKGYTIALHLAPEPPAPKLRISVREWMAAEMQRHERALAKRVYEDAYRDFYNWEPDYPPIEIPKGVHA